MSLTLDDPIIEQRIQRVLARGVYPEPAEVMSHALDLLEAEEDWLLRNREAIIERLEVSFAQAERGESYSPEEARTILAERRAARAA
jgi:Arc/MetJ-type ribon-helix-helix transcriptional regulator